MWEEDGVGGGDVERKDDVGGEGCCGRRCVEGGMVWEEVM